MKKLFVALFLMVVLLVGSAMAENSGLAAGEYNSNTHTNVQPERLGNYWYILLADNTAEIIKYTGSEKELTIPPKLNGVAVTSIGMQAFYNCGTLTSLVLPDGVTCIGAAAFSNCQFLSSITLPDTVTEIKNTAFYNCNFLNNITLPQNITYIADNAFGFCTSLTNVVIPDQVTVIGNTAFRDCAALASVTIPATVTTIGSDAFYNCPKLTLTLTPFSTAELYAKNNSLRYIYEAVNAWTCPECQNYNESDFCTECGTKQPEPTPTPAPVVVDDGSWDCTCGNHNTGKFCGACGSKKPELAPCPECGHTPEKVTEFCTECGTKFE